MKKLVFLFLALICLAFVPITETNKFVGRWTGEDKNEIGYLIFDNDGYAYLEINGEVLGGKEFTFKGKKGSMRYEINEDTSPIEVDLIINILETNEEKRLLCIAEFLDDDNFKFAMGFEDLRPSEFAEDNSIILTRDK